MPQLKWWMIMLTIIFVIYLWEWMFLYQRALADKKTIVISGRPPECNPNTMSWWQNVKSELSSLFSFKDYSSDPCSKYYRALEVSPVWEITPPMVLSSVAGRLYVDLVKQIGDGIGLFMSNCFSKIPLVIQIPLMICVALVILICVIAVILLCVLQRLNLELSIPWLWQIKLTSRNPTSGGSRAETKKCSNFFKTLITPVRKKNQLKPREYSTELKEPTNVSQTKGNTPQRSILQKQTELQKGQEHVQRNSGTEKGTEKMNAGPQQKSSGVKKWFLELFNKKSQ